MNNSNLAKPNPFRKRERVKTIDVQISVAGHTVHVRSDGPVAFAVTLDEITEASEIVEIEGHGFERGAA